MTAAGHDVMVDVRMTGTVDTRVVVDWPVEEDGSKTPPSEEGV